LRSLKKNLTTHFLKYFIYINYFR